MGRKRRRGRQAKRGGGALTRLRGGFRSTVHAATGTRQSRPVSPRRRALTNVVTVILLAAAIALVLRRFGVLR